MMFRRLYWVAEQLDEKGCSKVTGVYTSIQDLVHKGLHWCEDAGANGYRLTLVKPDSFNCPLGIWESPNFSGLEKALEAFVETNEYSHEECLTLQRELEKFIGQKAKAS